ncbi:lipid storage droplets surface-binding protein 1 isoform X2 [Metopolophium dirhodum]|uniref:lipid storage droplets surface-binding protein 1 isoform X2 n=1 Tax=Metopolophium dirhodum TaxID=44670 RepID=UPI00298FF6BF|nr:lipid storage droplets surface-binding protein 1 isoform X2 [Metopolophium dirhodum]
MTASRKHDLPHFVAINRIMKLPVVSSGVNKATYIYVKVKMSNRVIGYSLESAEKTVLSVVDMSVPLVIKFEDPINRIDDIMCKSLDVVEHNVPMVTYTPEEIYFTTKTFVKAKVEPVLKRADSVKQLSMLDDALSVADKYVDKYLPDKDPGEDAADKPSTEPSSQAVKTIRHVNHFSRKLQRRLTRRTIAEAKLLKKQGYDTVQCFVYFADLLAKDPKAFSEKMKAIWKHLSEDEPENQKPPENIEQLIEMLSREGARRFVHVTNFVAKNISMGPAYLGHAFTYASQEAAVLADQIIKYAHLENAKGTVVQFTNMQLAKYKKLVEDLRKLILEYLSSVSSKINESKKKETEKDNKNSGTVATAKPSKGNKVKSAPAATPAASVTTNGKP